MMIYSTNMLATPFMILLMIMDTYLFAATGRLVLGQVASARAGRLFLLLEELVDPLSRYVETRLASWRRRPVPAWLPWLIVLVATVSAGVHALITITTYRELSDFVTAFGAGHLNMLVLCSRGGLGKSEEARRALSDEEIVRIGGHVTPLKLYELLYKGRDRPVVFDEIDGLLGNPRHVGLLKQLCETRETKQIMWASADPRALDVDGGRGQFATTSHVLMLCNSFSVLSANVAALETRATLVRFEPSTTEILAKIKTFASDGEVLRFLTAFHEAIPNFSLRTYAQIVDLKNAGMDWQRYALQEASIPVKVIEIAGLLERFDADTERISRYSGSRRDYYNWKPEALAYLQRRTVASSRPGFRLVASGSGNESPRRMAP